MSAEELVKLVPLGTPVVAALIEAFVKPKLSRWTREGQAERDMFDLIQNKFLHYLEGAVENHGILKTVVFQNDPKLLTDLYQPLTLVVDSSRRDKIEFLVNCYPPDLIPKYSRILIRDDAGMGKSTVLRFLFLRCIEEKAGLPIFIELRHLKPNQGLVEFIHEQISPLDAEVNVDSIRRLIALGDFIFFLDGYDEIPEGERAIITQNIQNFITKAPLNKFILSSRDEPSLSSFSAFQGFSIRGLKIDEAYALIRRYGKQGGPAEELITELDRDKSSVEEFLANPMLVSLLFKAFSYKQAIPLEKSTFYGQVYDALFEAHDYTKPLYRREKNSNLSRDKFEQVLRALAIVTLKKGVGYPKNQLLSDIDNARAMCPGLEFDSSDFLQDLLRTVPLFAAEGDYHRWKHKSLQEYFASRYICTDAKENQSALLRKMVEDPQYNNVIDLCYDLDYKTVRNTIVYDVVSEFVKHYDNSYVDDYFVGIDAKDVEMRKRMCFLHKFVVIPSSFTGSGVGKTEYRLATDYAKGKGWIDEKKTSSNVLTSWANNRGEVLVNVDRMYYIIELLMAKKNDLVEMCPYITVRWEELDFESSEGSIEKHRFREASGPTEICGEEIILVDDNVENICNDMGSFHGTNSLLSSVCRGKAILDVEKCRLLKLAIEEDLDKSKGGRSILDLV